MCGLVICSYVERFGFWTIICLVFAFGGSGWSSWGRRTLFALMYHQSATNARDKATGLTANEDTTG
jgi:hypothetical protein